MLGTHPARVKTNDTVPACHAKNENNNNTSAVIMKKLPVENKRQDSFINKDNDDDNDERSKTTGMILLFLSTFLLYYSFCVLFNVTTPFPLSFLFPTTVEQYSNNISWIVLIPLMLVPFIAWCVIKWIALNLYLHN
mmetsp:Transcript_20216/g.19465  ORF Transcript_20216/g.19465 Transcript_20216/m.19465 type:complete len:136 (-) Transcript_20216:18-425(-)